MPSIQNEGVITPAIIHEELLGIREAVSASPPIVLQRSFCTDGQKFCGLQARFSCKDVRGPHRLTLNLQATALTRLRVYESATVSRFVFSRKIRRPATFDFCNTIPPIATRSLRRTRRFFGPDNGTGCQLSVVLASLSILLWLAMPSGSFSRSGGSPRWRHTVRSLKGIRTVR
jgi:hypothetical protein